MCIYLVNQSDLHYDSADHIFPAGLGGIKKLPLDFVSHEFNSLSSKFEQALMRDSIIALPRQILGPGKRGSLEKEKSTKSSINVFQNREDGSFSLGYISLGKPFEIPHVIVNASTGAFSVGIDKQSSNEEIHFFKQKLLDFNSLKIKMIEHSDLPEDTFIFGVSLEKNNYCYIASKDGKTHILNGKVLAEISQKFVGSTSFSYVENVRIKTHQTAIMDQNYYKCIVKIAFNCLAHLKGKAFMLDACFNEVRTWVVNGIGNEFVTLGPNRSHINKIFPEDAHHVVFTKIQNTLVAQVCIYNHFSHFVRLSDKFYQEFELNGFVCDWKNKAEHTYLEYVGKPIHIPSK